MFVRVLMILVPVEAGDEFRAVAYDCSTPSDIRGQRLIARMHHKFPVS